MAAVQEPWRPRTRADRKILNVRVVDLSIFHNIAESRLAGRPPEAVSAVRAHLSHETLQTFRTSPVEIHYTLQSSFCNDTALPLVITHFLLHDYDRIRLTVAAPAGGRLSCLDPVRSCSRPAIAHRTLVEHLERRSTNDEGGRGKRF